MSTEKDCKKLTYYKWYVDDVKALQMAGLSYVQIGELFCKIMESVEKCAAVEVSDYIKVPYYMQYQRVVSAQKAYIKKCNNLAQNGSKGGKAKAANRKAVQDEKPQKNGFKKPTKTDFRNAVRHICNENEFEYDTYEIDELYSNLSENDWKYGGETIASKVNLECVIYAEFSDNCNLKRLLPELFREKANIDSLEYMEFLEDDIDENKLRIKSGDGSEKNYPIITKEQIRIAVHEWVNQYDDDE